MFHGSQWGMLTAVRKDINTKRGDHPISFLRFYVLSFKYQPAKPGALLQEAACVAWGFLPHAMSFSLVPPPLKSFVLEFHRAEVL